MVLLLQQRMTQERTSCIWSFPYSIHISQGMMKKSRRNSKGEKNKKETNRKRKEWKRRMIETKVGKREQKTEWKRTKGRKRREGKRHG